MVRTEKLNCNRTTLMKTPQNPINVKVVGIDYPPGTEVLDYQAKSIPELTINFFFPWPVT